MLAVDAGTFDIEGPLAHYAEHGYARLGRLLGPEGLESLRERADDLMLGRVSYPGFFWQMDAPSGLYEDAPLGLGWQGPSLDYRKLEKLEKDARQVDEANRKLQSLFPAPGSQLSPQEKQQLQELAEQQQGLEKQAQGLRQQMQEMEQMAPLFGQEAGEQMEEIGRRMGEAAQRMQGKDTNRGHGEQQAALQGLKQFQQQMKESQRGKGKGKGLPLPMGMGRGQGDGRDPREKVEIPDEEAYQAPKEFRKDLLDAMKEGTPEKYRDQVKRYYEELVK